MRQIILIWTLLVVLIMACNDSTPSKPVASSTVSSESTEENKDSKSNQPSGALIYRERCVTCHGANGRMGNNGAKVLPESPLNLAQRIEVVTYGRKIMPGFEGMMTAEEIEAVAAFTMTLK